MSTTTTTKMPSPPARDLRSVVVNCAAFAVSAVFASGMWLVMR